MVYFDFTPQSCCNTFLSSYNNKFGALGDASTVDRSKLVQVTGLTNALALAAGTYHSLALKADGSVWGWGSNYYCEMGDGGTVDRLQPAPVPGLTGVVALAASGTHSLALKSDGTVWTWGYYGNLSLFSGCAGTSSATPTQVPGLSAVIAITGGAIHSLALKSDGSAWAWGNNSFGQLGNGSTGSLATPASAMRLAMERSGLM